MKKSGIISLSVFGSIALALITFGIYFIVSAESSSSWKKADAKVISYKVISSKKHKNRLSRKRKYAIQIKYQYLYNDTIYINNMVSFGKGITLKSGYNDRDAAIQWLNNSEFSRNSTIQIYVNPNNPNKSVIYKGMNMITFIPLIIGICFLLLVVYILKKLND